MSDEQQNTSPAWPTPQPGDLRMVSVQTYGDFVQGVTYQGQPMAEVKPAWWRRVLAALMFWRPRTRVFWMRHNG